MRTNYYYTTNATIIFDDEFELHTTDSLDNIVCKIEWAFREYGFTKAEVIDAPKTIKEMQAEIGSETGELLVTADNDH